MTTITTQSNVIDLAAVKFQRKELSDIKQAERYLYAHVIPAMSRKERSKLIGNVDKVVELLADISVRIALKEIHT